jgi:hypothetical protein
MRRRKAWQQPRASALAKELPIEISRSLNWLRQGCSTSVEAGRSLQKLRPYCDFMTVRAIFGEIVTEAEAVEICF